MPHEMAWPKASRETEAEMASQDEGDTHLIHVSATLETPAYATVCHVWNLKLLSYDVYQSQGIRNAAQ